MTSEEGTKSNHSEVSLNDSFYLRLSAHLESTRRVKFKGKILSYIYFTFRGEAYCTDSGSDPFENLSNCVISAFMPEEISIILLCPLASPKVCRFTSGDSRDLWLRFVVPKVTLMIEFDLPGDSKAPLPVEAVTQLADTALDRVDLQVPHPGPWPHDGRPARRWPSNRSLV